MKKTVLSKSKYVRTTARKARLVVDMIRGYKAADAVEVLRYTNKAAAVPVRKTLESAIANAENNFDMNKANLIIVEARVDEAPTYKRGIAVSRGRYHQILKRNCHIVIGVSEEGTDSPKTDTVKAEVKSEKVENTEEKKETKKVTKTAKKPASKEAKSKKSVKKES